MRLTPQEFSEFQAKADKAGLQVAVLIRSLALRALRSDIVII
jgi:hypothetical protein